MKVIQKFLHNSLRNFNYIVMSEETCECIFFDPCDLTYTLPELDKMGGAAKYLINTHQHPDHVRDNRSFLELEGTEKLEMSDGEVFKLSSREMIRCVHTPGHVKDHYCFELIEGDSDTIVGIICGDTVFNAGVGNCKDSTGNPVELYQTIKNIFIPMPDDVVIYPSHDYFLTNLKFALTIEPDNKELRDYIKQRSSQDLDHEFMQTTIGEEKKFNPFFRVFDPLFRSKFPNISEEDLFVDLRLKRDRW